MDIHACGSALGRKDVFPGIFNQIRFGQQDHGHSSGLPGQGQITFQPFDMKVHIQGLHDEYIVKIGRHGLLKGDRPGLPAGEEGPPGQSGDDLAVAIRNIMDHHKIPGSWEKLASFVVFFGFQAGIGFAVGTDDLIPLLMNGGHSGGNARRIFGIRHKAVVVYIQV